MSAVTFAAFADDPDTSIDASNISLWHSYKQKFQHKKFLGIQGLVPFSELFSSISDSFTDQLSESLSYSWHEFAFYLPGSQCLYSGKNGLILNDSFHTIRHLKSPFVSSYFYELKQPLDAFQKINKSIFLPRLELDNIKHFLLDTMSYLWPFFTDCAHEKIIGCPVLLSAANSSMRLFPWVWEQIRNSRNFPLLDVSLPSNGLHLANVAIPRPTFRLRCGTAQFYKTTLINAFPESLFSNHNVEEKVFYYSGDVQLRGFDYKSFFSILELSGWKIVLVDSFDLLVGNTDCFTATKHFGCFQEDIAYILPIIFARKSEKVKLMRFYIVGDWPDLDLFMYLKCFSLLGWFITREFVGFQQLDDLSDFSRFDDAGKLATPVKQCLRDFALSVTHQCQ